MSSDDIKKKSKKKKKLIVKSSRKPPRNAKARKRRSKSTEISTKPLTIKKKSSFVGSYPDKLLLIDTSSSSESPLEIEVNGDSYETIHRVNDIIYLNIGGYLYTTDSVTLYNFRPNYFTQILEGDIVVLKDENGYYFINRPGKYFEPILEYMIIGEVILNDNVNRKALVREARFYGIDFPLDETHESLSFITDNWLNETAVRKAYSRLGKMIDHLVNIVFNQFIEKADKNLIIESDPILMGNQQIIDDWLDNTEHGNAYWRTEFIDRQQKLYSQNCIISDEYYYILHDPTNRRIIERYFKFNNLSIKIVPVNIHEPGVINRHYFTIGYKYVHDPPPI